MQILHILDYCYSGMIMSVMAGGGVMCTIKPPSALARLASDGDTDTTDFYVSIAVVYIIMAHGIMALLTFPTANAALLALIDHFTHLDKILRFDGRSDERSVTFTGIF